MGDVLFCHGTPRSETECFTRLTPALSLAPAVEGIEARTVVCGHTHMQFDRIIRQTRVVNAGSVGMPFGRTGADWVLLGQGIALRHTDFDLADAAARVRATDYPQAADFASQNVLSTTLGICYARGVHACIVSMIVAGRQRAAAEEGQKTPPNKPLQLTGCAGAV